MKKRDLTNLHEGDTIPAHYVLPQDAWHTDPGTGKDIFGTRETVLDGSVITNWFVVINYGVEKFEDLLVKFLYYAY